MVHITLESLNEAAFLIACGHKPANRFLVGEAGRWQFADSQEVRDSLTAYRTRDAGIKLLLAFGIARDKERTSIKFMKARRVRASGEFA